MRSIFTPLVATSLAVAPIAALAHDDGKGNIILPTFEVLQQEAANVVAANSALDSNSPKSFAPCINGLAAGTYPCDGIDMMSRVSLEDLGLTYVNDMWGWTDPLSKKDYAIVGGGLATSFVDITDPKRPKVVGVLPARFTVSNFIWRDIKVHKDHAFIISEDGGSGIQIFDLTLLRNYNGETMALETTATYDGFDHSHNIAINEDTGVAYVIGSNTCNAALHMVDVSDPVNPSFLGCAGDSYIHDTQCVSYEGPDANFHGREICFNSAADFFDFSPAGIINTLEIIDVTDKDAPVQLSEIEYPLDGYSHQGWLSIDQSLFFHNDELDEIEPETFGLGFPGVNTTTRIFNVSDLTNPYLVAAVDHGTQAITHNAYTENDYLYAANYMDGLRIFDTTIAAEGFLPEVAYFDTYPEPDLPGFDAFNAGAWSNYPYFRQKKIVAVSSQDRGLFVLRPRVGE
jgi:choice-of-anchor B domain-containing protein